MKTCIRRGTFETNSSSTHSIMIRANAGADKNKKWTDDEAYEQLEAIGAVVSGKREGWGGISLDLGAIDPEFASFYRTEEAYNTFAIKLIYAIVSFRPDSFLWPALLSFLDNKLHIKQIYFKTDYTIDHPDGKCIGDIDHESTDALAQIFADGISMEEYLFRKDIYLMIDNEG